MDLLGRHVDDMGRMHSTRLILKNGGSAIPSWLQSLIKSREAYVLEESIVDPRTGIMETRTRNLSHRLFMSIEEVQIFTQSPDNSAWYLLYNQLQTFDWLYRTLIETHAKFHCGGGFGQWTGLPSRLEGLGVIRFKDHLEKSRQALMYVVERVRKSSRSEKSGSSNYNSATTSRAVP